MKVGIFLPAPPGTIYGKNTFDHLIGTLTRVRLGDVVTRAKVIEATVIDDGRQVDLLLEF